MYLHNANDVWVHMFAIVKLRGKWGEKNSIVITCS